MPATPLPQLSGMQDILDVKEVEIWDLRWVVVFVLSLVGVSCFTLLYAWFRRKKSRLKAARVWVSPRQEALQRLDALAQAVPKTPEAIRKFYFSLSLIFREFLEKELHLSACDATFEELKPQIERLVWLGPEAMRKICWHLEVAELAKFAKFVPRPEEVTESLQHCRQWIDLMAARRAPSSST